MYTVKKVARCIVHMYGMQVKLANLARRFSVRLGGPRPSLSARIHSLVHM